MNTDTSIPERLADYVLVREAGRGAMSTVYEARDAKDRRVALKVLHTQTTLSQEQQRALVERLEREARVMLRLAHPNVVRLFDIGQQGDEHFLVMEYLDGPTLRARLDTGPLSLLEASRLLEQAAAALDAIHAQGVVHRDVKPSNMMLVGDGIVKLMDFGVARQGDDMTITQTGMIVGSPAYMSPEQVRGGEITASTDLWALGIVLYEMLAGRSPFTGPNVSAVLYRVAHEAPAPVPGLSSAVQQVLRRALDKNPAKRYPTGRALADAFRVAALGSREHPQPLTRWRPSPRWPWLIVPIAALLTLLVGMVFLTRSHPRLGPGLRPPPAPFFSTSTSSAVPPSGSSSLGITPGVADAATQPIIQEVTPMPPGKALAPAGKTTPPKPATRKPASPTSHPHQARAQKTVRRTRRAPRRHIHKRHPSRIFNKRPRSSTPSQHWQNMERFIYHDFY